MALSGRMKIAIAVTGVAGAAALGMGGVALADPGGGTELRIVTGYQEEGSASQDANTGANTGWTAHAPGEDCPEGSGGSAGDPAQAADRR